LLAAQNLARGHTAPMESSFGTLKTESLHHYRFATRKEARRVVFEYSEILYALEGSPLVGNRISRHAKINNQLPADCAKQFNKSAAKLAAWPIDSPTR